MQGHNTIATISSSVGNRIITCIVHITTYPWIWITVADSSVDICSISIADGQVQGHNAIATCSSGSSILIVATLGVGSTIPVKWEASGSCGIHINRLVDGQAQGSNAVATVSCLKRVGIYTRLGVSNTTPLVRVACHYSGLRCHWLVDSQIQYLYALAIVVDIAQVEYVVFATDVIYKLLIAVALGVDTWLNIFGQALHIDIGRIIIQCQSDSHDGIVVVLKNQGKLFLVVEHIRYIKFVPRSGELRELDRLFPIEERSLLYCSGGERVVVDTRLGIYDIMPLVSIASGDSYLLHIVWALWECWHVRSNDQLASSLDAHIACVQGLQVLLDILHELAQLGVRYTLLAIFYQVEQVLNGNIWLALVPQSNYATSIQFDIWLILLERCSQFAVWYVFAQLIQSSSNLSIWDVLFVVSQYSLQLCNWYILLVSSQFIFQLFYRDLINIFLHLLIREIALVLSSNLENILVR